MYFYRFNSMLHRNYNYTTFYLIYYSSFTFGSGTGHGLAWICTVAYLTIRNYYPDKKRIWIVVASQAALWTGSFIALNKAWYADYPKQSFHFFNDWSEWQQMDKAGHAWTILPDQQAFRGYVAMDRH